VITRTHVMSALDNPDPWQGFAGFLERTLELQAADRGLRELVLGAPGGHERVAPPSSTRSVNGSSSGRGRPGSCAPRKTLVETAEQARELLFVSSPTLRINGRDIALELKESPCGSGGV
jgi:hypothetical protein